ncbi:hypothetical protein Hanom_Chr01g00061731 [Helianthus anomalus]
MKIVLKKKPCQEPSKPSSPPPEPIPHQSPIHSPLHQSPPKQPSPPRQPPPLHLSPPHSPQQIHTISPPLQQTLLNRPLFQTPLTSQPTIQTTPGSSGYKGFTPVPSNLSMGREDIGDLDFTSNDQLKNVEGKVDAVAVKSKRVADREKILEMRVKKLESDNKLLLKKIESDQTEIDILKVRVVELEEEKVRRDEQNKYFELKTKELEAGKAMKDHELYMVNKILENMLGKSIEQRFEEIAVEELRAKRQAEIDAQLKYKGMGAESSVAVTERSIIPSLVVENPVPISVVSTIFEEDALLEDMGGDDDDDDDDEEDEEEEKDEKKNDDDEKVFSASSHSSDNDDDDDQGGTGEDADGKGEYVDDQNVDQAEKLILRLEPHVEEGEIRHTYTLDEVLKMSNVNEEEFTFDFIEELNAFNINHQPEYEYKYVEDADVYDQVEVEDCSDEENVSEDTSELPTLMEFFSEENRDELRRKISKILKDKNFDGTPKDLQKEERKKWFKDSHERKFKRPLKYYQRDRSISLGDIISWGFLPQVNAYAIRRECGVQYFERLHDVMSLPWWDVEELSKVRTLGYLVRQNDIAMWGYIKFESLKNFRHWKPHYPKRVQRVDPVTGNVETILNVNKPKAMKNIPVPKMEQEFYKGFMGWVYSCISTEAVITYRAGKEIR